MNNKNYNFQFSKNDIYEVYSSDDTVLVAMLITFRVIEGRNAIMWFDTVKDRIMYIESIISDSKDQFIFKTNKHEYLIQKMSLDSFREIILPSTGFIGNMSDIDSLEKVYKLFFETLKEY